MLKVTQIESSTLLTFNAVIKDIVACVAGSQYMACKARRQSVLCACNLPILPNR